MPSINYDDFSDFDDLPSMNDIMSSKPVAQEKAANEYNPEVIALDTEIDDPDQTQMPVGYREQMKELEDAGEAEEDPASKFSQFMQSQHIVIDLDIPNVPPADSDEFIHSDEELSELEYFMSIDQLLARGGDERRRAEFILNQFNKNTGVDGPQRNVSKISDAAASGSRKAVPHLGARRSRKLFGK